MIKILLVEQDHFIARMYQRQLNKDYQVDIVPDVQSAIDEMDRRPPDLVITNIQLGDHNGFELIYEIKSYDDWMDIPILVLSSLPPGDYPLHPDKWSRYGKVEFLYQPQTSPIQLRTKIGHILSYA